MYYVDNIKKATDWYIYLAVLPSVLHPLPLLLLLCRIATPGRDSPSRTSLTLLLIELIFPTEEGEDSLLDWELKLSDLPLPRPSGGGIKCIWGKLSDIFTPSFSSSFSDDLFSLRNFGSRLVDFEADDSQSFSRKWICKGWCRSLLAEGGGASVWSKGVLSWCSWSFSGCCFLAAIFRSRITSSGSSGTLVIAIE